MTDKGSTVAKGSTKLIVFDWDGTLSDSVSRIVSCIQLAAADHQMLAPTFDQAKDIIGLGAGEPDFDTPQHIKAAAIEAA